MSAQQESFEVATPNTKTPPVIIEKMMALFDHESSQVFTPGRAGEHPSVLTPREGLGVGEAKAIVTGKSLILRNPKRDLFIFKHPRGYFTATCVAHNGRGEQYHDQMTFRPYDGSAKEGRSSIYYTGLFKHSSFRVGNAGNVEAAIDSAYQRHFG